MTEPPATDAFRELVARGLIAATPTPQPLSRGNADRKEEAARSSWLVALPAGDLAKLTLGSDLSTLAARHAAFAQACPAIANAQLARMRLPTGDALLESYFEGSTIEAAATDRLLPPQVIRQAVAGICDALAASEQTSSESARVEEWNAWCGRLLALPVWQPDEVNTLRSILLPALYPRLATGPAVTRWSNGDFLPANMLLNARGESRLIDAEFASRTHFFAEDAVRFQVLSPAVQDQPDLFAGLLPGRDLPWHLYFWLRQFQLEIEHNSPAYLARFRNVRLALIRSLGEHLLGAPLPGWSAAALKAEYRVEDLRWSQDSDRVAVITGWCRAPGTSALRGVVAIGSGGARLDAARPTRRPDVARHFGDDPRTLLSGFSLQLGLGDLAMPVTLCAMIDHGTLLPLHVVHASDWPGRVRCGDDYPAWAAQHDPDPAPSKAGGSESGPLFSILLPVYKTPEPFLHECISSVLAQHHTLWELCLVDDGSALPDLTASLSRLAEADPRIRVKARQENGGISQATNDALAMARGEYVVLLDHDDLLRPHALAEFAAELHRRPGLDAIYSDEDKITTDGRRILPFFKPDFSPEFLRGVMYVGHALCVRTSVARAVSGFDPAYDGVQDFEFFLRVTEQAREIGHIPRILYHWRQSAASSALQGNVKGNMDEKQAEAVQAHLKRRGGLRRAVALGGHRVRLEATTRSTHELLRADEHADLLTLLHQAARSSRVEVLVVLHPGIVTPDGSWLQDLVALAALSDSGCVSPVILSADDRVCESGRVGSRPIMHGFHAASDGYNGSLRCNREVDTVSPLCFALRRAVILDLPAAPPGSWLEFCAQLRARGLYHRVCASARVKLPDSWTMAAPDASSDAAGVIEFYNPNFDPLRGDYTLASAPSAGDRKASRLQFNVEQPCEWRFLPRCLIIQGWCFAEPGGSIEAIRLRTADLTLNGVIGLPRPDVKAAMPEAPDNTGFEIRGTLPAGRIALSIEAQLRDGCWRELVTRIVKVKRRILPLWLGGGDWMELMFFQMPAHMAYPARAVRMERFPAAVNLVRPRFTIITPSYNQARFLPETMRSVLQQPGVTCDYVVQDGGSTDGSREILAQWERNYPKEGDRRQEAGKNIAGGPSPEFRSPVSGLRPPADARCAFAWESASDGGQADAIIRGFAKTSGGPDDLMAWINSDDFYLPGALGYVADYFARHPDVDVLYGHRIVVNEESQEIGRWFLPRHDPEVLRLNDFVPQETLFWRRRIWDKVGGLDPSLKFAMDWDLLLRFQSAGAKIVRVPCFLACFRVHSAQKTSARMHDIGQKEITQLRERAQGRAFPPQELERNPRLLRYLRRSAFIEFLWRLGLRAP